MSELDIAYEKVWNLSAILVAESAKHFGETLDISEREYLTTKIAQLLDENIVTID